MLSVIGWSKRDRSVDVWAGDDVLKFSWFSEILMPEFTVASYCSVCSVIMWVLFISFDSVSNIFWEFDVKVTCKGPEICDLSIFCFWEFVLFVEKIFLGISLTRLFKGLKISSCAYSERLLFAEVDGFCVVDPNAVFLWGFFVK